MDARRTLLGDAALRLIGAGGIRAMTHHKIDDEAGIARGSTSFYCRKRVDMLRLSLERLYELDLADLTALARELDGRPPEPGAVAEAVASLIEAWLSAEHRPRTIARIELFMAASHEPELQSLIGEQFATISSLAIEVAGATRPGAQPEQTAGVLMLAEGLMLAVVRQGLPTPDHDTIVRLLRPVAGGGTVSG